MRLISLLGVLSGCGIQMPEPPAERDCQNRDVYYQDTDGDGFGADDHLRLACSEESGWSATGGDCDDTDADVTTECHQFDTGEPGDSGDSEDTGNSEDTGDSSEESS